jgi:peroxiredoxin Q/BCP
MALTLGDKVPYFEAYNAKGQLVQSTSFIGKQVVVVYFYPKDDTPGCTMQACTFRDNFSDYQDLGATVVGVSSDDTASHQRFQAKYDLPFELLADSNHAIRKLFGVPTNLFGLLPGRVTYVIDATGKIVGLYNSQMPGKHHEKAIALIKKIA